MWVSAVTLPEMNCCIGRASLSRSIRQRPTRRGFTRLWLRGGAYTSLGAGLSEQYGLDVVIPDLRGHGPQPVHRGDVDYVGQLKDDVADLIGAYGGDDRPVYVVDIPVEVAWPFVLPGGQYGSMLTESSAHRPIPKVRRANRQTHERRWERRGRLDSRITATADRTDHAKRRWYYCL